VHAGSSIGRPTCRRLRVIQPRSSTPSWRARGVETSSTSSAARPIQVVRETERLLIVNKPPGMSFHADQNDELGLVQNLKELQRSGDLEYRGEIHSVHRLDRVTSGLVIFAKDLSAASHMSTAFQQRRVIKFVYGLSPPPLFQTQNLTFPFVRFPFPIDYMMKHSTWQQQGGKRRKTKVSGLNSRSLCTRTIRWVCLQRQVLRGPQ